MILAKQIIMDLRRELMQSIRNEVVNNFVKDTNNNQYARVINKIRRELSERLEKRGVDISKMQIDLRPDKSNVMVCIRGE